MKTLTIILCLLFSLSIFSQSEIREDHKKHIKAGAIIAIPAYTVALSATGGNRLKALYYSVAGTGAAHVGQEWIAMWHNPANYFDYTDVAVGWTASIISIAIMDLGYHHIIKPLIKRKKAKRQRKLALGYN